MRTLSSSAGVGDGLRKDAAPTRQGPVKTVVWAFDRAFPESGRRDPAAASTSRSDMSVVVFIVLTMVIFALLGLVQRWVENL